MADDTIDGGGSAASGLALIVLTLAGWTAVPLLIEEFTADIDNWTANGWRYGFAALLWMPLLIGKALTGKWRPGLFAAALVPGLVNAVAQVCFTTSFYKIDPSLMTFGLRFQMVAVTVGAALFFPAERRVIRAPMFLLGMALLILGIIATALIQPAAATEAADAAAAPPDDTAATVAGVLLSIGAGGGFGAYAIAVRWFMRPFGVMESFAAVSQYTAACMILLMFVFAEQRPGDLLGGGVAIDMTAPRLGLFLLSAVIGIAAGHVIYYASIARLGVTVSSGIIQLQPFTVAVASVAIYGAAKEQLAPAQWITGLVAVAGAIVMLAVQHRVSARAKAERLAEGKPIHDYARDLEDYEHLPPDMVAAASINEEAAAEQAAQRPAP